MLFFNNEGDEGKLLYAFLNDEKTKWDDEKTIWDFIADYWYNNDINGSIRYLAWEILWVDHLCQPRHIHQENKKVSKLVESTVKHAEKLLIEMASHDSSKNFSK